jgi:cytochrome c oxidase assembly factor CtaG
LHTLAVITSAWRWNVAGLILCLTLLVLYGAFSGFRSSRTLAWFLAGVGFIALVMCSPLDLLAREYLFTAYAIEQMLIGLVAPYLLVRGMPGKGVRIPRWLGWAAGMVSLSVWFLRYLLVASLTNDVVRGAELVILIAGGAAFWWPIHSPSREQRIPLMPHTLLYLATATVWCSLLGLFLAFEKPLLIARYVQPVDSLHIAESLRVDWSFTRETDQQTAGLLFWIGAAAVLLTEVMFTYYRWYNSPEVRNER